MRQMIHTPAAMAKNVVLVIVLVSEVCGCTSYQLSQSSVAQSDSLMDLEYRMVLDNIAMFVAAPDSLPWHLIVSQGSVTVNDNFAPSLGYSSKAGSMGSPALITGSPGFNASRALQDQWTVAPVVDTSILSALQSVYNIESKRSWFHRGSDPEAALMPCGNYGNTYVWVDRDHMPELNRVTLLVLKKASEHLLTYRNKDFQNIPEFADHLANANDKFSIWLWSKFSSQTKADFIEWTKDQGNGIKRVKLSDDFLNDLNHIIQTENLADVRAVLASNPAFAANDEQIFIRLFERINPPVLSAQAVSDNGVIMMQLYPAYVKSLPKGPVAAPFSPLMQFYSLLPGPGYNIR